jgi:hypothetical protein
VPVDEAGFFDFFRRVFCAFFMRGQRVCYALNAFYACNAFNAWIDPSPDCEKYYGFQAYGRVRLDELTYLELPAATAYPLELKVIAFAGPRQGALWYGP